MTDLKRCTKCNADFPRTSEFFQPHIRRADGYSSVCRECERAYRRANAVHRSETTRRWQKANSERDKARKARWWDEHPEKRSEYNRRFRLAHPEVVRANHRRWREANRDYVNADMRERWRERYAAKYKQVRQLWRKTNVVKMRAYCLNYQAKKRGAEGRYTDDDILGKLADQNGLCFWCSEPLPSLYHVDHVIPLSRGGSNDPDNLVCACVSCNTSKSNKLAYVEWMPPKPLMS